MGELLEVDVLVRLGGGMTAPPTGVFGILYKGLNGDEIALYGLELVVFELETRSNSGRDLGLTTSPVAFFVTVPSLFVKLIRSLN